jgi:hypothetical protein
LPARGHRAAVLADELFGGFRQRSPARCSCPRLPRESARMEEKQSLTWESYSCFPHESDDVHR